MEAESLLGFFQKLLDQDFMPHGHCYFWRPDIVWLHVASDASIALAYYSIPLTLLWFMYKRKDFPFPWLIGMFGAFILLCGTGHIMDIVTLWVPVYRLDGVVRAVTAVVSVLTAVALVPLVPQALALRSPKELEAANARLADANEKLREIDRLKDDFFSNVSHELRTPLTLILAPLESFLARDYGAVSEGQRRVLEAMHNNSVRLYQMVSSILDFAKIGAAKVAVKREPLEVLALTQSILDDFRPVAGQKGLRLSLESGLGRAAFYLDRHLYERIVFNLLSNAVKFTPDGGAVAVSLTQAAGRLKLAVSDTGIGISEADQRGLFQRFRQVEGSSTRRFEGTGLGLALVKEFSVLLGGDVSVASAPGKGSTFTAELAAPAAEAAGNGAVRQAGGGRFVQRYAALAAEEPGPAALPAGEAGPARIVLAEDNVELAAYVAALLRGLGETKVAKDGDEAAALVKEWRPDILLADVMMPKRDGIALCRDLKASPETAQVPVVLLSALTHRDALVRGWEAGADEYLFKPFHPRELVTRVRALLAAARDRRLLAERTAELEAFSYTLSHDLKAPLRRMTSFSRMVLDGHSAGLDPAAVEHLRRVEDAGTRLYGLIDDVLAFARVGRAELRRERVDLSALASEVVAELRKAEPARRVEFRAAEGLSAEGDPGLLRIALENLLGNAWKFTSRREAAAVEFGAEARGGKTVYFVRDDGAGFDMAHAGKLFTPFERLHAAGPAFPGTGIGLASVRRIVERHGGRVWAEAAAGKGAVFFFTLA